MTTPDPMAAFQAMLGHTGMPLAGLTFPTNDLAEIDRRIAEFKTVEGWLQMNLSGIQMMRQALEMQRNTLLGWQQLGRNASEALAAAAEAARSSAMTGTESATAASGGSPQAAGSGATAASVAMPSLIPPAAFDAMAQWWQQMQNAAQQALAASASAWPGTAPATNTTESKAAPAEENSGTKRPRRRTAQKEDTPAKTAKRSRRSSS